MRTTTLVFGIISTFFIGLGLIFKALHFPGGAILTLFGFLILLVYELLFVVHISRQGLQKQLNASFTVFAFGTAVLASGFVFVIQRWPGGQINLLAGGAIVVVALILFLTSPRTNRAELRKHAVFPFLSLLLLLLLSGSVFIAKGNQKLYDAFVAGYFAAENERAKEEKEFSEFLRTLPQDSVHDGKRATLLRESERLQEYIRSLHVELVSIEMGLDLRVADTLDPQFYYKWDDRDVPTNFLVGYDPAAPTGRGKELLAKLQQFRDETLAENVELNIDLPKGAAGNAEWISKNFYLKTTAETLSRLATLRKEIMLAAKRAIGQDHYR